MLKWAVVFLVISIIAGIFGFRRVESVSTSIAKGLFFIFIIIFALTVLFGSALF
ncbi:DUF1328 domain-containing protein [Fusibacter sp. JL298sf-3]